jgi:hypothetical protein
MMYVGTRTVREVVDSIAEVVKATEVARHERNVAKKVFEWLKAVNDNYRGREGKTAQGHHPLVMDRRPQQVLCEQYMRLDLDGARCTLNFYDMIRRHLKWDSFVIGKEGSTFEDVDLHRDFLTYR